MLAQPHEAVASGSVASFRTDVISPLPMEFDLVPIQSGTGDPSPDNIRPITGHDGFTRTGTGKNLLGGVAFKDAILIGMPSATVDTENGTVTFKGTTDGTGEKFMTNGVKFKENTRYSFVMSGSGAKGNICWEYTDGTHDNQSSVPSFGGVYTSQANKSVLGLIKIYYTANNTVLNYMECGIFEGVLSASDFEAYKGTSESTTFPTPPGTVYGGHVKDNGDGTGNLTVTHGYLFVDGSVSVANVSYSSARSTYYVLVTNSLQGVNTGSSDPLYSNMFKSISIADVGNAYVTNGGRSLVAVLLDQTITTKEGANQWFEDNNAQFVYPLATPVTYTLPLDIIRSLIGQNNVWVDNANSVTVEYWGH